MGRFLLVELEPDLAKFGTTHNAAFLSVQHVNGVRSVCDLSAISRDTLATFLMTDAERAVGLRRNRSTTERILRRYWAS
ncbi:MAG TPA: hypothetical protein VNG35_12240 [Gemmatimonadales bacterium]|nr:hypothetical protein [Gemmatimonadales bacterium]